MRLSRSSHHLRSTPWCRRVSHLGNSRHCTSRAMVILVLSRWACMPMRLATRRISKLCRPSSFSWWARWWHTQHCISRINGCIQAYSSNRGPIMHILETIYVVLSRDRLIGVLRLCMPRRASLPAEQHHTTMATMAYIVPFQLQFSYNNEVAAMKDKFSESLIKALPCKQHAPTRHRILSDNVLS